MSSDLGPKPDSEPQIEALEMPKSDAIKDTETKENVDSKTDTMPDSDKSEKSKALPEPIRGGGKNVPRLPPIDMAELTSILQGPNMPSQKLMKEVTEKIKIRNDESGSDDGSVSGSGGVGIRGILDCILEVSLFHQDSEDESDVEGDEIFVRELPCRFCKKIFGSTMNLKTHVLMTHSQEDPSVLNVRNQSRDGTRREKLSPLGRSRSMEGKEKESSLRGRKKSSSGHPDSSVSKEDKSSKDKLVRSRHNSREHVTKASEKVESPRESSSTVVDSSKITSISSQKLTRQSSVSKDDAKSCDLKTSVVSSEKSSEQTVHSQQEDILASPKATKRKSQKVSSTSSGSSSPSKKARRSQTQSGEPSDSSFQPRRSSRRK